MLVFQNENPAGVNFFIFKTRQGSYRIRFGDCNGAEIEEPILVPTLPAALRLVEERMINVGGSFIPNTIHSFRQEW